MSEEAYERESEGAGGLPGFARDPVGMVRRRWLWMLPLLVVGLITTALVVLRLEPYFLASATVLVRSQQIPETFVRTTVEEDPLRHIDEMLGQVLTRDRVEDLVATYGLYADLEGSLPHSEIVSMVRESIMIEPAPGYGRMTRGDSARIFTVSMGYAVPAIAAEVANHIAGLLPTETVRSRTRKARLTTQFLQRELERADLELREQNAKITGFKELYRGELPGELDANLSKLERLQAQRQSLALQIAESANRATTLAAQEVGTPGPVARLEELRRQLAVELASQTERHPDILALRSEIALIEAEIARDPSLTRRTSGSSAPLVAAEQTTLRELRSQLATTERVLADLDVRVARTPARQEKLAALEEKASVLRESYLEFLRKVQEAELAQSLEATQAGERVSVLNWAEPPTRPEGSRWKYLAAGLLASIGASLGVGIVLETFDPVLLTGEQMEAAGDLPVLGSVPRIS